MEGCSSDKYTMGNSAQEKGLPYVPDCYLVPMADRPNLAPSVANIPVIDLAKMPDTHHRSTLISQLSDACRRLGFFQVSFSINYTYYIYIYVCVRLYIFICTYHVLIMILW